MSIDNSLLVEEQGRISNSDDLKIKKARPILRKVRPRNDVNLGSRTKRNVLVAKYRINAKPKESDFNNNGNQAVRRVVCEQDDRPPSNEYTTVKNASVHSKYNDTYNKGPFTTTEKNAVKEALEEFMRDNGISKADLPMLFMRSKSVVNQKQNMFKGRREWTSWLIKVYKKCNLNRTLTQFSHHIRRAFRDNLSKGAPWTKEEDDALIGLYALKGSKWGEIERELGRRNARSRYIRLQHLKNNSAKLGRYTYEELYKLGMVVKNIAIRENLKDLKAFNLWSMVEKEIDGRSAAQLQKCWSSRSALILANLDYDPSSSSENRKLWEASGLSNTWTLRDDMKLINLMCDLCEKASDETEVIWESLLLPEWRDKTPRYLKNRWSCLRSSLLDDCVGISFRGNFKLILLRSHFANAEDLSLRVYTKMSWNPQRDSFEAGPCPERHIPIGPLLPHRCAMMNKFSLGWSRG